MLISLHAWCWTFHLFPVTNWYWTLAMMFHSEKQGSANSAWKTTLESLPRLVLTWITSMSNHRLLLMVDQKPTCQEKCKGANSFFQLPVVNLKNLPTTVMVYLGDLLRSFFVHCSLKKNLPRTHVSGMDIRGNSGASCSSVPCSSLVVLWIK